MVGLSSLWLNPGNYVAIEYSSIFMPILKRQYKFYDTPAGFHVVAKTINHLEGIFNEIKRRTKGLVDSLYHKLSVLEYCFCRRRSNSSIQENHTKRKIKSI